MSPTGTGADTSATLLIFVISDLRAKLLISVTASAIIFSTIELLTFAKLPEIALNIFTHNVMVVTNCSRRRGRMIVLIVVGLFTNWLVWPLLIEITVARVIGQFGCHA